MEFGFKIKDGNLIAGDILGANSGSVNVHACNFEIQDADSFLWICVFKKGETAYQQVISDGKCMVPYEVLESPGSVLVGCYGTSQGKRISTNWLPLEVKSGAYVSDATAPEVPLPDVWEELITSRLSYIGENGNWQIYDLSENEYKDSEISARGDKGDKGDKGDSGADGYTPIRGVDYWTDADQEEIEGFINTKTAEKANQTDLDKVEGIAKGAQHAAAFDTYQKLCTNDQDTGLEDEEGENIFDIGEYPSDVIQGDAIHYSQGQQMRAVYEVRALQNTLKPNTQYKITCNILLENCEDNIVVAQLCDKNGTVIAHSDGEARTTDSTNISVSLTSPSEKDVAFVRFAYYKQDNPCTVTISDIVVEERKYKVGQNFYIAKLNVPDVWISAVHNEKAEPFDWTGSDAEENFVSALTGNNGINVGYYTLSPLETQKVNLENYVEKEAGKGLSQNDYTNAEKAKVAEIGNINEALEAVLSGGDVNG